MYQFIQLCSNFIPTQINKLRKCLECVAVNQSCINQNNTTALPKQDEQHWFVQLLHTLPISEKPWVCNLIASLHPYLPDFDSEKTGKTTKTKPTDAIKTKTTKTTETTKTKIKTAEETKEEVEIEICKQNFGSYLGHADPLDSGIASYLRQCHKQHCSPERIQHEAAFLWQVGFQQQKCIYTKTARKFCEALLVCMYQITLSSPPCIFTVSGYSYDSPQEELSKQIVSIKPWRLSAAAEFLTNEGNEPLPSELQLQPAYPILTCNGMILCSGELSEQPLKSSPLLTEEATKKNPLLPMTK